MAKTRSARLLAVILALIMIGSIAAFGIRGIGQAPKRNVKYEAKNLNEIIEIIPDGADQILYINLTEKIDRNLLNYSNTIIKKNTIPEFIQGLKLTSTIKRFTVVSYPDGLLYLLDVNKTKVYYTAKRKINYMGYDIKISYYDVAMCDQISPLILGTPNKVLNLIECVNKLKSNFSKSIGNYTSRIGKEYVISMILYGETAKDMSKNLSDFYFIGYRMNGTYYEKFVALHFIENAAFVESNATELYYFKNFDDGFGFAVMCDKNFTKILQAKPEIRALKILKEIKKIEKKTK